MDGGAKARAVNIRGDKRQIARPALLSRANRQSISNKKKAVQPIPPHASSVAGKASTRPALDHGRVSREIIDQVAHGPPHLKSSMGCQHQAIVEAPSLRSFMTRTLNRAQK